MIVDLSPSRLQAERHLSQAKGRRIQVLALTYASHRKFEEKPKRRTLEPLN